MRTRGCLPGAPEQGAAEVPLFALLLAHCVGQVQAGFLGFVGVSGAWHPSNRGEKASFAATGSHGAVQGGRGVWAKFFHLDPLRPKGGVYQWGQGGCGRGALSRAVGARVCWPYKKGALGETPGFGGLYPLMCSKYGFAAAPWGSERQGLWSSGTVLVRVLGALFFK